MILHVMDTDFTLRGEAARYTSLNITRERAGAGAFEVRMSAREAEAAGIALERIIFPVEYPERAAIIESVTRTEGTDEVAASGVMLAGLTRRRIALPGAAAEGTYGYDRIIADAESVMKHYAAGNMTAPEDAKRRMECVILEENAHRGMQAVPWSARYETLEQVLTEIAAYTDAGYDIVPNFNRKKLVFRYVPGRELAGTQGKRVTFSLGMGNAAKVAHRQDATREKTTAYVGGAGEDEKRDIYATGTQHSGIARREMFVDAGSAQGADELKYEGGRKLLENAAVSTLTCEAIDAGPLRYGTDWDIGDRVSVEGAGAAMYARITKVTESYDTGRPRTLTVTFGEPQKGIVQIIQSLRNARVR